MGVRMYVYASVCMAVCMSFCPTRVCVCGRMSVGMAVGMRVCKHARVHVCMSYMYMCVCV